MTSKIESCPTCGNTVSKTALHCPKCQSPTDRIEMVPCRACGKLLDPTEQFSSADTSRIENGTTKVSAVLVQYPCPYCGDTKPLRDKLYKNARIQLKRLFWWEMFIFICCYVAKFINPNELPTGGTFYFFFVPLFLFMGLLVFPIVEIARYLIIKLLKK